MTSDFIKKMAGEDKTPVQWKHNWLYSVLPITQLNESRIEENVLYLSGYCRACDNAFSVEIPRKLRVLKLTKLGVPKWGCVDPKEVGQ